MIEYKLIKSKSRRYPFVLIKSYPGFFNYCHCKAEDVEKHKENLAELYKVSINNA